MRFLGIDPGLQVTGYGIIETGGSHIRFVHAGCIKTASNASLETRLLTIHAGITKIINTYPLDAVVLEKLYAHYKHPVTACLLGHARGIICLVCAQHNIRLFEYAATRVKKAIVGKGHAPKQQIQHMVRQILNLAPDDTMAFDSTDALSLAIAHSHIAKKELLLR